MPKRKKPVISVSYEYEYRKKRKLLRERPMQELPDARNLNDSNCTHDQPSAQLTVERNCEPETQIFTTNFDCSVESTALILTLICNNRLSSFDHPGDLRKIHRVPRGMP